MRIAARLLSRAAVSLTAVAVEPFRQGGLNDGLVREPLAGLGFLRTDIATQPLILLGRQAQAEGVSITFILVPAAGAA